MIAPTPPDPGTDRSRPFPARFLHPVEARRVHGPLVDAVGHGLWRSDPLADDLVAALAREPGAFAKLEQALREGVDRVDQPPPELVALMREIEHVPPWVDWGRIRRGGEAFFRTGPLGGFVLGAGSLMAGYASSGGNKPLAMSGRLEKQATRRLAETTRFVFHVMRPGGLRRDGDGLAITVKVRVMHAQVRRLLRRTGTYDVGAWGEPINQHDMMGTLLLFSSVLIQGTRRLGCDVRDDEADDIVHLWRYVGHLIGVEPQLAPTTFGEALRREAILLATQGPADEDGRALAEALIRHVELSATTDEQRRVAIRQQSFAHGLVRGLIGDDLADQLGIRNDRWRAAVPAIAAVVRPLERVRRATGPLGNARALAAGMRHWSDTLRLAERGVPADFAPPASLGGRRR